MDPTKYLPGINHTQSKTTMFLDITESFLFSFIFIKIPELFESVSQKEDMQLNNETLF